MCEYQGTKIVCNFIFRTRRTETVWMNRLLIIFYRLMLLDSCLLFSSCWFFLSSSLEWSSTGFHLYLYLVCTFNTIRDAISNWDVHDFVCKCSSWWLLKISATWNKLISGTVIGILVCQKKKKRTTLLLIKKNEGDMVKIHLELKNGFFF